MNSLLGYNKVFPKNLFNYLLFNDAFEIELFWLISHIRNEQTQFLISMWSRDFVWWSKPQFYGVTLGKHFPLSKTKKILKF